jgi:hypothetical protein
MEAAAQSPALRAGIFTVHKTNSGTPSWDKRLLLPEAPGHPAQSCSGEKRRKTCIFDWFREVASLLLFDSAGKVEVSRRTTKEHATQYY